VVVAFWGDEVAEGGGDEGGEGMGYWLEVRAEDGEGLVELGGHFAWRIWGLLGLGLRGGTLNLSA